MRVFLGNGDGTFGPAQVYGPSGTSVAVADVNGDGIPDLVAGGVNVLLGNGDGTFRSPLNYGGGSIVAVGDFNRDGYLDVAAGNSGGTVAVLINTGNWGR